MHQKQVFFFPLAPTSTTAKVAKKTVGLRAPSARSRSGTELVLSLPAELYNS